MDGTGLPALGETFAGKYRIERVLGQGGSGIVYEATHLRLNQRVAIKMLLPEVRDYPEVITRFEREARACATLDCPEIAKVLDVDSTPDGLPYMVIEYLEGYDLGTELDKRIKLPIHEGVALVIQACVPIALAHAKGIVHRDLKPANLFLAMKAGKRTLKLLDFGISKVSGERQQKATGSLQSFGTPEYMSPEQIRQTSSVDHRTDVWSLGIILYELITGKVPFSGSPSAVIAAIAADPITSPKLLRGEICDGLERVMMKALEKDPDRRFQDVLAFASALVPFGPEQELVSMRRVSDSPVVVDSRPRGERRTASAWSGTPLPAGTRSRGTRSRVSIMAMFLLAASVGALSLLLRSEPSSHAVPPVAAALPPSPTVALQEWAPPSAQPAPISSASASTSAFMPEKALPKVSPSKPRPKLTSKVLGENPLTL